MVMFHVLGYIGPGAGVSLIGALVGLGLALGSALFFVLLWPLRMLMKKVKQPVAASQENTES